ncbi:SMEK domain-containing protein [Henriciella pelagia]|jgi:hypothetical protein|uniref:SMEK domain-containing protein n=1 Tax=Henriciella pelagia TaxID=1977912 RepID=A0ABQ1JJS9_9PROT|nr:SMEK domain-containing protein [Henriciella pelagia]GGB70078.1 hypothetical protein GCM10011503_18450 [Henriciella pelagia]
MNRLEYLQRSQDLLARLTTHVTIANSGGHFDINQVAEDVYTPVLAELFGCPDLRNQNRDKSNFPAIDLGSEGNRISFQVTSDRSSAKITETLRKFREHQLHTKYDEVYVLIITTKQESYSSTKLAAEIDALSVEFDVRKHIIDYRDLSKRLSESDTAVIQAVCSALEQEYSRADATKKFNQNLQKFLEIGRSKIEFEKNTGKYIPAVFVECCAAKDAVRYFANPLFFHRKIDDAINRLSFDGLNELLGLAGVDRVEVDLAAAKVQEAPSSLDELSEKLTVQNDALVRIREAVAPFAWGGDKQQRYKPVETKETEWQLFSFQIESSGSGIQSGVDKAIEAIYIAKAKIFLVTGMAGQGKTNFVCDLIENQFRKFEIPSLFVPARELNNFQAPNRIVQFIANNRYAPEAETLHELLSLFERVANENSKPFVIAIDGINEVGALSEFNAELKIFLDAVCQYQSIKVLITCRSEFFDQRFSTLLSEPFSDKIYRINDLKSRMSNASKDRLIEAYFKHFSISLDLSKRAANFLKNDLLLLRIFCENRRGSSGEFVSDIYKGDLFESYLRMRADAFSREHQRNMVPTLFKIAKTMIEQEEFSHISLRNFTNAELETVDRLISDDVVLRREVPDAGLSSIGSENASFIYDELRDYVIAEYVVSELSEQNFAEMKALFERLPQLPIREGLFRYVYLLSRMRSKTSVLELCEESEEFLKHYALNLHLIAPNNQNDSDAEKIRNLLNYPGKNVVLRDLVFFLFSRRNNTEIVNIELLIDHINSLTDTQCAAFMKSTFSEPLDFGRTSWKDRIGQFIEPIITFSDEEIGGLDKPVVSFALQVAGFSDWETKEKFKNRVESAVRAGLLRKSIELLIPAKSETIRQMVVEITEPAR